MNAEQRNADISNDMILRRSIRAERARLAAGAARRAVLGAEHRLAVEANKRHIQERNAAAHKAGINVDSLNLVELLALYS